MQKNKNILIIGAGKMSRAITYDLLRSLPDSRIDVLDSDQSSLSQFADFIATAATAPSCTNTSDQRAVWPKRS